MKPKIVLPNYDRCLVNISSSILRRFNIKDEHKTLKELDEILPNYKKVILVLFDGLGSFIMDKHLDKNSFLQSHKKCDISSVFPPTTAAATTSLLTCKNPNETGWLGWHMYFKEIDKDLIMFRNEGYYNDEKEENYSYKYLPIVDILSIIKDNKYITKRINSFDGLDSLNDFENEILKFDNEVDEGFMYAYHTNPDHLMHLKGTNSSEVHDLIIDIDKMMEDLSERISDDSLVIMVADHGHIDCELINLYLDENIKNNLVVKPYCDNRATMFRVKDKNKFYDYFKHTYGGVFDLYSKEEVLEKKLFGNFENNPKFYDLLGDFIAIGKGHYYLDYIENEPFVLKSVHSGYTEQEMIVPLVLINRR